MRQFAPASLLEAPRPRLEVRQAVPVRPARCQWEVSRHTRATVVTRGKLMCTFSDSMWL